MIERRVIEISHPTDRPNFAIVEVGDVDLAFSYRVLIGVRGPSTDYKWRVVPNKWGPTTGKHLNYLVAGKREEREVSGETLFALAMESLREELER